MHIAIAGNIGSGKTTLTKLLSQHYGYSAYYDDNDNNPYLNEFYSNMERWSFNLQIYFLQSRLKKILEIRKLNQDFIQDRTIYEDAYIFAQNLFNMGLLSLKDYKSYLDLFEITMSLITPPDLIIYLRANVTTLINQIKKRGRSYESNIDPEYLNKLNDCYNNWAISGKTQNILTIDIDQLNFPNRKEDLLFLIGKIDEFLKK